MTEEELNKLAREIAHQAVNSQPRAYLAINDPVTAITILAAIAGLFLWSIATVMTPVEQRVQRSEKEIEQVRGDIKQGFSELNAAILKLSERVK